MDRELLSRLRSAGVLEAARELEIAFDHVFLPLAESTSHPYRRYRWSVGRDEYGQPVIHALPPEEELGWTPWERWSGQPGQPRHTAWVLFPLDGTSKGWRAMPETGDLRPRLLAPVADLADTLERARVPEAAAVLGFDHTELLAPLSQAATNRYLQYRWVVVPHVLAADGPVIYALPPMHLADQWPWESWYSDGTIPLIHHVHYTASHPHCTGTWSESAGAPQRPPEIFGVTWYWYDDPSLAPAMWDA